MGLVGEVAFGGQVRKMKPCELKKNPPGVTSAVRAPGT
jgi:hypothetical protein